MIGKRTRWALLVILVLVAGAVAGVLVLQRSNAPTGVALVNTDTGPTGAQITKGVQDAGIHEWTIAEPGEVDTADYAAVITLPADLSSSLDTLSSTRPQRAQLVVDTATHADADLVDDAVNEVTRRISAAGMDRTLTAVTSARRSMQQAAFTTELLGAGVRMAGEASDQFGSGADEMLGFLDTAKGGARQVTAGISQLDAILGEATTQADGLADALDATGVTIGQISGTASALEGGVDQALPLLRALPFANDPRLTDAIGKLETLQGVSSRAGAQLAGFAQIAGSDSNPSTPVSTLLRDASSRLSGAGGQLNDGAELAKQVPQVADRGAAQLTGAMQALTGGVTQLQQIVTNLDAQTGRALNVLPVHSNNQQSTIATNLSDPVEIVRS